MINLILFISLANLLFLVILISQTHKSLKIIGDILEKIIDKMKEDYTGKGNGGEGCVVVERFCE